MFVEAICYCRLHINQGEDDIGVVVLAGIGPGSNFVFVITGEEERERERDGKRRGRVESGFRGRNERRRNLDLCLIGGRGNDSLAETETGFCPTLRSTH